MSTVVVSDQVRIPDWVDDLKSFRRWARSSDYPERGWISYLNGEIWVDMSMEQLFTHNHVKTEYATVLSPIAKSEDLGYYFSDRAPLISVAADLATEPDGMFVSFDSLERGSVRLIEARNQGYVEIEGSPDMVFEVVSRYSVHKDTVVLRDLYWRAGIQEYWLVDVRKEAIRFDILRHNGRGYVKARPQDGWIKSAVFGRWFKLEATKDRLGNPQFSLRFRK